jgi:hypothetical protein
MTANRYAYLLLHRALGHEASEVVGIYSGLDKVLAAVEAYPAVYGQWERAKTIGEKRVAVFVARFETLVVEKHRLW